jgi:hypothetical protein
MIQKSGFDRSAVSTVEPPPIGLGPAGHVPLDPRIGFPGEIGGRATLASLIAKSERPNDISIARVGTTTAFRERYQEAARALIGRD